MTLGIMGSCYSRHKTMSRRCPQKQVLTVGFILKGLPSIYQVTFAIYRKKIFKSDSLHSIFFADTYQEPVKIGYIPSTSFL